MNGYIGYYRGKQVEVEATTSYGAQQAAARLFKAKRTYQVTVVLVTKGGQQISHSTAEFG